ncbi:conserved protein of unknown function [Hyphomicrobium sp. 1Nfss2.1]|uniref:hypothetical protein n=1 Tax=Hyphomicrobium sp. 1Nfss2.1 TaxID=3413936 RepID=UPI003C7AC816
MKFRYKGDTPLENLLGNDWSKGSIHDYTDAYSIQKLTNNPTLFEAVEAAAKPEKPSKGKAPKPAEPEAAE